MLLIELFGHNSWATLRLLDFCRELDPGLLDASAPGVYRPINETLAHLVGSEEMLAGIVEGTPPGGPSPRFTSLDDLQQRSRWLAERWARLVERDPHPERVVERDRQQRRLVRVGTVLTQVLHHSPHHRAQVCTVLRTVKIVPPALDAWTYGAWLAERADRLPRRPDAV
jgi:uncharacterized damage-inducible protein DinB